jgi:toxin YoeB
LTLQSRQKKDIAYLKNNGGKALTNKIEKLLVELIEHPKTGTGQVEQLKGNRQGQWSRRIDKKNRLVYSIDDEIVTVEIISAKGHYGDK